MFTYLDAPWQRYWLITLLAIWAILLFGGFLFGRGDTTRRMPTWTRITSSFVLVIAAWSWVTFSRDSLVAPFALLISLGMSLGFAGDLFMAGLLPGGRSVLGGMAAFGLGHLFYIAAILTVSIQFGLNASALWGAFLVWLFIGVLGWYFVVFRGQKATTLHWAALPYALLLASTAGFATGLALQATAFVPLATGAVLFLLSDLILAAELFNNARFPFIGDVIWLTYGPAQMLIVYAVGAAWKLLE
ncbi:MAG TPA: lysoplasmalogenase family protein [Anaerolineae bacterium]